MIVDSVAAPPETLPSLEFVVSPAADAYERLQKKAAALETFLEAFCGIAHDLRNSLALIRGSSQILMDAGVGDARYYAGLVNEEAVHLGRLTEDLLDLSQFNIGKFKLSCRWIDLVSLAQNVAGMANTLSERHTIEVDWVGSVPPVFVDVTRIRQVVTNLLTNAIKYSPNGGTVHVLIGLDGIHPDCVSVSVEDQGIGIPAGFMPDLFKPFATGSSSASIKGNGLGLAVCQRIVQAHGGEIWADSREGVGTTLTFTLPCDPDLVGSYQDSEDRCHESYSHR